MENPVKVSYCGQCSGWVRVPTSEYLMDNLKAKNEFMREVMNQNLSVKEMPVEEFRSSVTPMCECKK